MGFVDIHGTRGSRSVPGQRIKERESNLLAKDIRKARILTYGYDADVIGGLFKGKSKNNITQHGRDLMLKLERVVEGEPIIFVAHNLGGILVKKGLHWSKSHLDSRYRQLHECTKHVLFLGVPHRGSGIAGMGEPLARLANAALQDTNKHLVASLDVENELLDGIHSEFGKMVQLEDFSVYSFQEGSGLSGLKGFSGKVVSDFSSKLDHPLETVETIRGNHMEMARFSDEYDEGYRTLFKVIERCVAESQRMGMRDQHTVAKGQDGYRPSTPEKRVVRIPYLSNSHFIGREKELFCLQAHLADVSSNAEQRRVAVWGPGGAGKTQLVSTYAFRNQSRYSAVFWVNASSDTILRKDYADIAKHLDLGLPSGEDPQTAINAVRDWFTDHKRGDWLLVIDNADNLKEVNIQPFIPPINKGHVIITSRNRETAELGTGIEIGEMEAEDAMALLFHKAAISHPTSTDELIGAEITHSLGYLALAIEHAGAYVHSAGGTLEEYLQQFQKNRRETLEESPAFSMHKESVFETFTMSFKAVVERSMAAARLLCFMGFLDTEGAREDLILSTDFTQIVKDEKEFFKGLKVLISFSLIHVKIDAGKKSISLHPLVHYLCRARLNVENQWRWKLRVVIWLFEASVAMKANMVYFPHVREQMQQMEEIKTLPADGRGRKRIYCCLALLQQHYEFAWQNQGAMAELHRYSETVMKVLEEDLEDQDHLSVVAMVTLVGIQADTLQFMSSEITFEQHILRYLLKQMTPLAKEALEKASNSQKRSDTSEGKTRMPIKDDVTQDGSLTLHTLTRALTQTFDSEAMVTGKSVQEAVEATQGSIATTISPGKSQYSPKPDDEPAKCELSRARSNDHFPNNQKPGLEEPPPPTSPIVDKQATEENDGINAISPSTREPATASPPFTPTYLSDVFLSVTPPIRVQNLLAFLSILIKLYYSHHRVTEADLLTMYSTLPVDSTEQAVHAPLQVSQLLIEASRLVATQDLDGMLDVYRKIISIGDGSTEVCFVSIDYAIMMNKLGRPREAERVIIQIFYSSKPTAQSLTAIQVDRNLARDHQSLYAWIKKSLATSQRLQGLVDASLATLSTTLETAQTVFGINSLSYLHAALLLRSFYSCNYNQQASSSTFESNRREEQKDSEMFVRTLESLYCSGKNESGGGGKPGALEETVAVFEAFAELSGEVMGEDDGLSRKARRAAVLAREEWDLAKKEMKGDILKFGTIIFPRKMEDLAALLED
ncbi:MAG: hypothetical protein Q9169_001935 [Polycauliona sp. 2 TL-2023]